MRLFFATDLHGSDVCFKKFVNAAQTYSVDLLVLGGDVSGKGIVPIIPEPDGGYSCHFLGTRRVVKGKDALRSLEKLVTRAGFYPATMAESELTELGNDEEKSKSLFEAEIRLRLEQWIAYAEERLPVHASFYWMAGNDDPHYVNELLAASERLIQCSGSRVLLRGGIEMISLGFTNKTPFNSPQELSEDELEEAIGTLLDQLHEPERAVFNLHCPPVASGLDLAPELSVDLAPVLRGGHPSRDPVGSTAVRAAIERCQPVLGLHGHVHESRRAAKIGRTLCLNPGSEYATGMLCGVVVELSEHSGEVLSYQFVTG